MLDTAVKDDIIRLVDELNFREKIERSLRLIEDAYRRFGDALVVANSLGKDSVAVWHLAKQVSPTIRGFIVTTRYKPAETVRFMFEQVDKYPEMQIFKNDEEIPDRLFESEPDRCCEILKVQPTREAIDEMGVACWVTGLRCTEGRTRIDFREVEERDAGLVKLNPVLLWKEREVWQYLALHKVDVNPLYLEGYRSLGCEPCTRITADPNERAGRWVGTSKCGGECGIHTKPLKAV
jgi:phosphoadenosine phosphosulfate reductase